MRQFFALVFLATALTWSVIGGTLGAEEAANPTTTNPATLEDVLIKSGLPAWLLQLTGDVSIEIDELQYDGNSYSDLIIPINLQNEDLRVHQASLKIDDGKLTMNFDYDRHVNRFIATATGNGLEIDLFRNEDESEPSTDLFNSKRLLPAWVETLRGSLKIDVQESVIDQLDYSKLTLVSQFSESNLNATFDGNINNASFHGSLIHTYENSLTKLALEGTNLKLDLLPSTRGHVQDIPTDFRVDISGFGDSMRQIATSVNGTMLVEFGSGNINIDKLNSLSKDILSLTLTSLIPISLGPTDSVLECGALKLDINNGIAVSDNTIALRTNTLAIMGGGEINFKAESLDLMLEPHARNSGKLNTKTAIKNISIEGPFTDLSVTPHLGGIINQGISLTAKIASLGLAKIPIPVLDWAAPADIACMKSLTVTTEE